MRNAHRADADACALTTSEQSYYNPSESTDIISQLTSSCSPADVAIAQRELFKRVHSFYDALPERLQDVAYRHFWLDQDQVEIAARLGVTRSAVCKSLAKIAQLGRVYFGVVEH